MKDDSHDKEGGGGDSPRAAPLELEDRQLMAALVGSARLDVPPDDLEVRVLRGLSRRGLRSRSAPQTPASCGGLSRRQSSVPTRRAALVAAMLAVAAAVVLWARRGPRSPGPDVVPEARPLASSALTNACAHRLHAAGGEPMIDDFEDGDGILRPLEGRRAGWIEVRDSDPPGVSHPLVPDLRPEPSDGNRLALHARGGEFRDWGATVQFTFAPPCYDASIYAGIAFSARGPGRLYLALSEVRVVATEWGGTCTRDCYNAHVRKIDLDGAWRRFEVRWSDLRQRGYEMPPLDPRSLHTMGFAIHAEDTPYDLWIDDVTFLTR
jgi:hypothetical protein